MKQKLGWLPVILMLLALVLPGCAQDDETHQTESVNDAQNASDSTTEAMEDETELWVMFGTDNTGYPSTKQREDMAVLFEERYPGVKVRLETVPADETQLRQLKAWIMAGDSPDVYLMAKNDKLLADPYRAMMNGLFADITEYYDADSSIEKDRLNDTIMNAGTYGGRRYILPIGYDIPVAYVDVAQFEARGGSMDMFDGGIMELYEQVFATGNPYLATGLQLNRPARKYHSMNYLPQLFDYENLEVLVTEQDIADFLRAAQTARAAELVNAENPFILELPYLLDKQSCGECWRDQAPMYFGTMIEEVLNAGFTKLSGIELAAVPIKAADGDLVADVVFYGAVGAGSKQPELAYEFISMFLTEDFSVENFPVSSVVTIGWPARYRGNAEELSQQRNPSETYAYFAVVYGQDALPEIKDEDITLLNAQIDRVQYFTALEGELSTIITTLNDPETDAALPVDIDAMAKEFYDKLYFYLYEG